MNSKRLFNYKRQRKGSITLAGNMYLGGQLRTKVKVITWEANDLYNLLCTLGKCNVINRDRHDKFSGTVEKTMGLIVAINKNNRN